MPRTPVLNLAKMKACADAAPPLEIPAHHNEVRRRPRNIPDPARPARRSHRATRHKTGLARVRTGSDHALRHKIDTAAFVVETRYGVWGAQVSLKPKGHSKSSAPLARWNYSSWMEWRGGLWGCCRSRKSKTCTRKSRSCDPQRAP